MNDGPRRRKSRPSIMFSRSVETKLFSFPTKLLALPVSSLSSSLARLAGNSSFFLLLMLNNVADRPLSSPLLPAVSGPILSATETLSGVVAWLPVSGVTAGVVLVEEEVSAFTRMRRACSKTSCVTMAEMRTTLAVWRVRKERDKRNPNIQSVTDSNINIPLKNDGTQCWTKEKVCDPNPWAYNSTFPAGFKIPKEHFHNRV